MSIPDEDVFPECGKAYAAVYMMRIRVEDHHVPASAGAGQPSSAVKESHVEGVCVSGAPGPALDGLLTRNPRCVAAKASAWTARVPAF